MDHVHCRGSAIEHVLYFKCHRKCFNRIAKQNTDSDIFCVNCLQWEFDIYIYTLFFNDNAFFFHSQIFHNENLEQFVNTDHEHVYQFFVVDKRHRIDKKHA